MFNNIYISGHFVNSIKHKNARCVKIRKYHKWTTEECERLVELRNEGKTFEEIADVFGVSRQSIHETYYRTMKLPKNYLDQKTIKRKVLAQWIKWNYGDINNFCKQNNLQRRTVENILKARNNPNFKFCELIMKQSFTSGEFFLNMFETIQ